MKVHLRFDSHNLQHCHMTIFVDGQNTGHLCMSPAQSMWFHHMLSNGATGLKMPSDDGGKRGIHFVASGSGPVASDDEIDAVVNPKS